MSDIVRGATVEDGSNRADMVSASAVASAAGLNRPGASRVKRARAKELRRKLIGVLGGKCATCGETYGPVLQIDHIHGRTWTLEKKSSDQRIRIYWREYDRGVPLQVLCGKCNNTKNARVRQANGEIRRRQSLALAGKPSPSDVPF